MKVIRASDRDICIARQQQNPSINLDSQSFFNYHSWRFQQKQWKQVPVFRCDWLISKLLLL